MKFCEMDFIFDVAIIDERLLLLEKYIFVTRYIDSYFTINCRDFCDGFGAQLLFSIKGFVIVGKKYPVIINDYKHNLGIILCYALCCMIICERLHTIICISYKTIQFGEFNLPNPQITGRNSQ